MASVEPYTSKRTGKQLYKVRYRDADRKQREKGGFIKKQFAQDFANQISTELAQGMYIDRNRGKLPLATLSDEWLLTLVDLRPSTVSGYEGSLRKHVLPVWGSKDLNRIEHADVQKWVTELSIELKPSTVRSTFQVLRSILDYAIEVKRIRENPCVKIRLPRLEKHKTKSFLTFEQVVELSKGVAPYSDIVGLLVMTGIRWGELVGLNVEDVDFRSSRLDINKSISEVGGKLEEGPPKNGSRRSVPFPAVLAPALQKHTAGKSRGEAVFTSLQGSRLRNTNFRNRIFDPAVAKTMLSDPTFPKITIHDLRHTAASLAVSQGANVKSLQRMLGHATAAMTLDTYAELFEDDLDAVGIAMNALASSTSVGDLWG